MSLIQNQEALVKKLEPIYLARFKTGAFGGAGAGMRSKAKRLHVELLMGLGYSKAEAWESAEQADEVAQLNASHASFMDEMGATA